MYRRLEGALSISYLNDKTLICNELGALGAYIIDLKDRIHMDNNDRIDSELPHIVYYRTREKSKGGISFKIKNMVIEKQVILIMVDLKQMRDLFRRQNKCKNQ